MSFYKLLYSKLKKTLSSEALEKLPRSYNVIGRVIILRLHPELEPWKREIGKAVLELLPVQTVCALKEIRGEIRKPEIEVIAGNGTITLHREHKCIYKIDVAKFIFSKGNKGEKLRIVRQIKPGEIVVDMFAGIGYFTIPIAKLTKAERIYAIDINPEAIAFLKENVKLNKVNDKVIAICGDCRKVCLELAEQGIRAHRVLMGYIFQTRQFLESALHIAKEGAIVHYHFLSKKGMETKELKKVDELVKKSGRKAEIMEVRKVKSYAPRIIHYTADIRIK